MKRAFEDLVIPVDIVLFIYINKKLYSYLTPFLFLLFMEEFHEEGIGVPYIIPIDIVFLLTGNCTFI